MVRFPFTMLCSTLLVAQAPVPAPTPNPGEWLQQAKLLWTGQGDREGASAKLEQILVALTPQISTLDASGKRILCETYNWLAVLDDRKSSLRNRVPQRFQAIMDLDPEFSLDPTITPAKLSTGFDTARNLRFPALVVVLQPEDGTLFIDGKPAQGGRRRLSAGKHAFTYRRAGYTPTEVEVEVTPGPTQTVRLELPRVASTLAFQVHPIGAEILWDGKLLGKALGQAGPESQAIAEKLGLAIESLSAPFQIGAIAPGAHRLEVRSPCHRSQTVTIPESLTSPLGDYLLKPFKLETSAAKLTLTSPHKGGEAFLDGVRWGPLPLNQQTICPGTHTLSVRFAAGGFTRTLVVSEGQSLTLEAHPKPRMAFFGLEGEGDFPGRARLEAQIQGLETRLGEIAFLPARPGEKPSEARARITASRDTELLLEAKALPQAGVTLVELRLSTLDGLEERRVVKPLDQAPLGELLKGLEFPLPLTEPSLGLLCIDVPGEAGPWVLDASEEAQKAGIQAHRPITSIEGQPVTTVSDFRAVIAQLSKESATVTQGALQATLPVHHEPLELPLRGSTFSYPRIVAELRLRIQGASGPEAGLLRLNLARAYLHYGKPGRALEILRDATLPKKPGVSAGTLAYLTGICLSRLGSVYISEAIQAFNQALQDPGATLMGPDGPPVAPLARAALQSLQP